MGGSVRSRGRQQQPTSAREGRTNGQTGGRTLQVTHSITDGLRLYFLFGSFFVSSPVAVGLLPVRIPLTCL